MGKGKNQENEDPRLNLFALAERDDPIESLNTHKKWLEDASNMKNNSMPNKFTENMEWMDWKATLINSLKSQPGSNGATLNYVIRDNFDAIVQTKTNFIYDYVDMTPITGIVFNDDASKVYLYIARLIYENGVAEQKLPPHKYAVDGCVDYFALHEFYEGLGANEIAVLTANK